METSKICTKCNIEKKLSEYYKKKSGKDGYYTFCKECDGIYKKTYYTENKESIAIYKKAYREENKEKIATKDKIYREENKESLNAKSRDYHHANKESLAIYKKTYYAENKEYLVIKSKAYNQTRMGRLVDRNKTHKRRFLKLANNDGTIPTQYGYPLTIELNDLMIWQNHKCIYCDSALTLDETTHLDHIVPLSKGGEHSINNVQWLCSYCNLHKSDMSESEFLSRRSLTHY